jgi:hypothetical protein
MSGTSVGGSGPLSQTAKGTQLAVGQDYTRPRRTRTRSRERRTNTEERISGKLFNATVVLLAVVQELNLETPNLFVVRFEHGKDRKWLGRRSEIREPEAPTMRVSATRVLGTLILAHVDLEVQA